jgi:hypothetical protein
LLTQAPDRLRTARLLHNSPEVEEAAAALTKLATSVINLEAEIE